MEGARRTLSGWRLGGLSQDGGSQEDPLEMEGARRTFSGWRPGGLSQDGGSQEDPVEMIQHNKIVILLYTKISCFIKLIYA